MCISKFFRILFLCLLLIACSNQQTTAAPPTAVRTDTPQPIEVSPVPTKIYTGTKENPQSPEVLHGKEVTILSAFTSEGNDFVTIEVRVDGETGWFFVQHVSAFAPRVENGLTEFEVASTLEYDYGEPPAVWATLPDIYAGIWLNEWRYKTDPGEDATIFPVFEPTQKDVQVQAWAEEFRAAFRNSPYVKEGKLREDFTLLPSPSDECWMMITNLWLVRGWDGPDHIQLQKYCYGRSVQDGTASDFRSEYGMSYAWQHVNKLDNTARYAYTVYMIPPTEATIIGTLSNCSPLPVVLPSGLMITDVQTTDFSEGGGQAIYLDPESVLRLTFTYPEDESSFDLQTRVGGMFAFAPAGDLPDDEYIFHDDNTVMPTGMQGYLIERCDP